MDWFDDAGLGLFIHWGVYSAIGRGEWVLEQEKMPLPVYDLAIPAFTAEEFEPDVWMALARDAGMRYVVFTAKHHDGFCLFDTATTRRNACCCGPRRDLVAEVVASARKFGLRIGIYFSLSDWSVPAFVRGPGDDPAGWEEFVDVTHAQILELCEHYGHIDLLWFDQSCCDIGHVRLTAEHFRAADLIAAIRYRQPDILINDRLLIPGDFYTAEQNLVPPADASRRWEGCCTLNRHWGFFPADRLYKSAFELQMALTGVLSGGGNLLLNVGPDAAGRIDAPETTVLQELGNWVGAHQSAVYGVRRGALSGGCFGCVSEKAGVVYLYIHWPSSEIVVPDCPARFSGARLLDDDAALSIAYRNGNLYLGNFPAGRSGRCSVIALSYG